MHARPSVLFPCARALLLSVLLTAAASARPAADGQRSNAAAPSAAANAFAKVPLHFEPRRDLSAAHPGNTFVARGPGYEVLLAGSSATLSLAGGGRVKWHVVGAQRCELIGEDRLPGHGNYYVGDDPAQWRTEVPHFGKVRARGIKPGIDLVFYGNQRELEYDVVAASGADPRAFELQFEGLERLVIDSAGELVIETAGGELRQRRPQLWQDVGGRRRHVEGRFVLRGTTRLGFEIGAYDPTHPLVIDPTLVYGTFLGGSGLDLAWSTAVDLQGNMWLTGETDHSSFPTTSGAYDRSHNGLNGIYNDVFVCKLNPGGTQLIFSTFLGGSRNERGCAVAIDNAGQPYIVGYTESSNFPTTSGAYDTSHNGGNDAFVAKLDATGGQLVKSTFLGGTGHDFGWGIAVEPTTGIPFVAGYTSSTGFPTTSGAYDRTHNGDADVFVTKLAADFATLSFSTFVGGSGSDRAFDIDLLAGSIAIVTGDTWSSNFPAPSGPLGPGGNGDLFAIRLGAAGATLTRGCVLGGSGSDYCWGATIDSQGQCYMTGNTTSTNFPTTVGVHDGSYNGGSYDSHVVKLNASLDAILAATYVGGRNSESCYDVVLDSAGRIGICGFTESTNYPVVNAIDASYNGAYDAVVTVFNPQLSRIVFSSFFGSSAYDAALGLGLDGAGILYVTGYAGAAGFPTTSGSVDTSYNGGLRDAMAIKISNF